MKNRFVVISTVYNKGKWVRFNVNSVRQQSFENFIAIYSYDQSTDNTLSELKTACDGDSRCIVYVNPTPGCFLNSFMSAYKYLKENSLISPNDVIVEIDGDDWLLHPFVFQHLNDIYQNPSIWMTYGQYVQYPSGNPGGHISMELNDQVDRTNSYRLHPFPYSHLKTYKAFLVDGIHNSDLIDPTTGKYFNAAADFALCMPLVEQAGKARIFRCQHPLYVYNTSTDLESETNNRLNLQKEVEERIRRIKPKSRI